MSSSAERELIDALMRDLLKASNRVVELLNERMVDATKITALTLRMRELEAAINVVNLAYQHLGPACRISPGLSVAIERAVGLLSDKGATLAGIPVVMDTTVPPGTAEVRLDGKIIGTVTDVTFTPEED